MSKRFKVQSQGTLKIYWNVIDTWNSEYIGHLMTRYEAKKLAKEKNKAHRIRAVYLWFMSLGMLITFIGAFLSCLTDSVNTPHWICSFITLLVLSLFRTGDI